MTPHHALSAVNRLFRDMMSLNVPLGEDQEQNNFQVDFINGITSGMPPHLFNLKVGAVIMLLRNLNQSAEL
ncbi:hypothetical protein TNCV_4404361 [Trichonephila clavipes]|uniref:DNA helicase Pif1-like 2B domain-containing protein n=1 Tax=Trichonephila clavipes TaxID=2585209 RepID=A0A8X6VFS7_TRICX|nr:hypothetical protein TNCV_4404361 [Trichonephila clavipes]